MSHYIYNNIKLVSFLHLLLFIIQILSSLEPKSFYVPCNLSQAGSNKFIMPLNFVKYFPNYFAYIGIDFSYACYVLHFHGYFKMLTLLYRTLYKTLFVNVFWVALCQSFGLVITSYDYFSWNFEISKNLKS